MEALILDTDFKAVDLIDIFESLIWADRYNTAGDFELYLVMDESFLKKLKQDYYLWNTDSEHVMIIEDINIISDVEDGNKLCVTGRSLESILDRRIVWGQRILRGNFQTAIQTLLNENIISPSIADRRINNFIFEASTDKRITSLTIDTQYTGDNLYDVIHTLCAKHGVGFKITLNDKNQFVFRLYMGIDRSYEQTENPFVEFSPSFDNIVNSSYLESKKAYKNVTLVAGEGEGSERKTAVVGSGVGLERREMFTDARDISSDVGDGVTLTAEQYTEQLVQRGTDKLAENIIIKAFEGQAETSTMYVYGVDFSIGDVVQVANEYGHESSARISELVMSQTEDEVSIYPTFQTT